MTEESRLRVVLKCISYTQEPKLLILLHLLGMAWEVAGLAYLNDLSFLVVNKDLMNSIKGEDTPEFSQQIINLLDSTRYKLTELEEQVGTWYIDGCKLAEIELGTDAMAEFCQYVSREFKEIFEELYCAEVPSRGCVEGTLWEKLFRIVDACKDEEMNRNQNISEWIEGFKEEFFNSEHIKFVTTKNIVYSTHRFEKQRRAVRRILLEGRDKDQLFDFREIPGCCSLIHRLVV
ncbi:hypothetical protein EHEL_051310 [Encephalitozoon hellem ATCC 50504]|uniref:Uncharacterized protein n=1 Tax=Encephalitozoon hellem TaxID=27973 RepID=A0A9Q9F9E5_ENCHE|nr:uncharacterized protein EHEL_051310 [Encephalitozoon hellem ATCC 50504]AFM98340.1 hypothetical protein EHEL_051310 [Encephalitozoon hellem ATCC 50504]UTX43221.1 hypothetical protein GPU96_05g09620 [Encephalitozoon hellem]|eukprot:XP_003887321.1 hypothetical protein EHEL_051310 [Encephalitozoon hellem ATCC 50504]